MDWRDLRIALAVDRHRTLGEAGRALQLDPTTVSRRVTALEEALGTALFVRGPGRVVPGRHEVRMNQAVPRVLERRARVEQLRATVEPRVRGLHVLEARVGGRRMAHAQPVGERVRLATRLLIPDVPSRRVETTVADTPA
jgi:DNA-binding transcriptional LysR family regulator